MDDPLTFVPDHDHSGSGRGGSIIRAARGWFLGLLVQGVVKGTLPVGLAQDLFGLLAVGTDGKALVADSAQSLGVKWDAPAPAAHTLASHSTKAHSELTGVGADDHHAQAHHAAHEPGGGDAMAVDAAAATGSLRTLGTGAQQAAAGNHTHTASVAEVYNNADLNINNNSNTGLTFNAERSDTDSAHSLIANTGRLTPTIAGYYIFILNIEWAINATGVRTVEIVKNAGTVVARDSRMAVNGDYTRCTAVTPPIYMNGTTDFVFVNVYQLSGGVLAVKYSSAYSPNFSMHKIP